MKSAAAIIAVSLLIAAGCSTEQQKKRMETKTAAPASPPAEYKVQVATSKGAFVVHVHRDWAPRGADRFYELVKMGYYDDSRFFRVVKNFVVQFGLSKDPKVSQMIAQSPIADDPAMKSNMKGRLSFAKLGPGSRTGQVFVNLRNNRILDDQGFAPFGEVIEGMDVVEKIYAGYGDYDGPNQAKMISQGNSYLDRSFPRLDKLNKASLQ